MGSNLLQKKTIGVWKAVLDCVNKRKFFLINSITILKKFLPLTVRDQGLNQGSPLILIKNDLETQNYVGDSIQNIEYDIDA